jgi:hypothetical protein
MGSGRPGGDLAPGRPEDAAYQVEVAPGRVLAVFGARAPKRDTVLLRVFLDQLRLARQRVVLDRLQGQARPGEPARASAR